VPVGQLRRTLEAVRMFRANFVFGVLLLLLSLLLGRFAQLQLVHGATYRAQAEVRQAGRITLAGVRGRIVDVHGRLLATSSFGREVAVDPDLRVLPDTALEPFCARLAAILDDRLAPEDLRDRLREARSEQHPVRGPFGLRWVRTGSRHVVIRGYVDEPRIVAALDEAGAAGPGRLQGLKVRTVERRSYPNGSYAAHVIGLPPGGGADEMPGEGVEALLDDRLEGTAASAAVRRDGKARSFAHGALFDRALLAGGEVRLSLDIVVQHHLETVLDDVGRTWAPLMSVGIVLDPATGAVLALANRPTFDPNPGAERAVTGNLAVAQPFEPGSVLKPFTVAWALARGFPADTVISMPMEHLFEGDKKPVRDSHEIGDGDVVHLLAHSSNVGAARLSDWMGPEGMPSLLAWMGIAQPTGIELPHERVGNPPRDLSRASQLRTAFGYSLRLTPLRLAADFAAFARADGCAVRPTLASHGEAAACVGEPLARPGDLALVRRGLEGCVDIGTAREAFAGSTWRAAGKTGTAIIDDRTRHVCSFVGYAPREAPRVIVLVMVVTQRAQEGSGGKVAAPAVRKLLDRILPYLGAPEAVADAKEGA
jgi:cell division protein FtsI (penicillin-binding protein 3)